MGHVVKGSYDVRVFVVDGGEGRAGACDSEADETCGARFFLQRELLFNDIRTVAVRKVTKRWMRVVWFLTHVSQRLAGGLWGREVKQSNFLRYKTQQPDREMLSQTF